MGTTTEIAWTDSTFNPWIGCTKVSQGCARCYAESQNNHYGWNKAGWGKGKERKRTSEANWKEPLKWAKKAALEGRRHRVFCASLADVLDPEVDELWRGELFELMEECAAISAVHGTAPNAGLEWLLLTKRSELIGDLMPRRWLINPPDYVRLGVTVEDQHNEKRLSDLLGFWRGKNFVSVEPLLSPVRLLGFGSPTWGKIPASAFLHWVIVGGESGADARPMHPNWARSMRDQCQDYKIPFLFKQHGEYIHESQIWKDPMAPSNPENLIDGRAEHALLYGKEDLMEIGYQWPDRSISYRVGKKKAGRRLDGRIWNEFPE